MCASVNRCACVFVCMSKHVCRYKDGLQRVEQGAGKCSQRKVRCLHVSGAPKAVTITGLSVLCRTYHNTVVGLLACLLALFGIVHFQKKSRRFCKGTFIALLKMSIAGLPFGP